MIQAQRFVKLALILSLASAAFAQNMVVEHVKICRNKSPEKRLLVCKVGTLTFDDSTKKLSFQDNSGDNLSLSYEDVGKVIFEVTTQMRGGQSLGMAAFGAVGVLAAAAAQGQHVNDYWMYVAPKEGRIDPFLLEIQKDSSQNVIDKSRAAFGERATVTQFEQEGAEIDKHEIKDLQTKYTLKINKQERPLPELRADKALVVVVCPIVHGGQPGMGIFKLHANDRVIAVNTTGTYAFAYLDPGRYRLASQSENANGFVMDLEAGKDYYFLQNTFMGGWGPKTSLSRNSKELVMYELDGTYYSNAVRKGGDM